MVELAAIAETRNGVGGVLAHIALVGVGDARIAHERALWYILRRHAIQGM